MKTSKNFTHRDRFLFRLTLCIALTLCVQFAAAGWSSRFSGNAKSAAITSNSSFSFAGQRRLYSISGRVTINGSIGLANTVVTCNDGLGAFRNSTDVDGNYSFMQLTAGRSLTISISKSGYVFGNPTVQIPNLDGDKTGIDFTGHHAAIPTPTPVSPVTLIPPPIMEPTDPNSTGYSYSNFTSELSLGVSIKSGMIIRKALSSGYGIAYAQANEKIDYGTGDVALKVNNTNDALSFGLTNSGPWNILPSAITLQNTSSSGTPLSFPTYGIAIADGNLKIWHQESNRLFNPYACNSCVQAGDIYHVYSDEGTIKYYRERSSGTLTLLYSESGTSAVTPVYPLLPQISISSNGSQANVKVMQPAPFGLDGTIWVSPNGTTYASGADEAHATTITLACNGKRPIKPGDTVIMADGTYTGSFVCENSGTANAPITYRAETLGVYPPTVTFTNSTNLNTLRLLGDYEIWKNIEIQNTSLTRVTAAAGSSNQALIDTQRNNGWRSDGIGNQLINSIVHDEVNGIVSQTRGGTYVYGCVTYNNGFSASDGGAGHGIYVHNEPQFALSRIVNTVSFGNYGLQMQFYNQTHGVPMGNMTFDKVVTMNGMFGIYGHGNKDNITVENSHMYNGDFALGYQGEQNLSGTITNNYSYGESPFSAQLWTNLTITGNKFVGKAFTGSTMMSFRHSDGVPSNNYVLANNTYYRGRINNLEQSPNFRIWANNLSSQALYTWARWQRMGFDTGSTYYNTANEEGTLFSQSVAVRPNTTDVYVYPNIYENGRATIVVWNWPLTSNVKVNLSGTGLVDGQAFTVISLQSGATIYWGIYSSDSPTFPMPMMTDAAPIPRIGDAGAPPRQTSPEFMVALVMPVR